MLTPRARLENDMNNALAKIKLGDKAICEVTGPQLVVNTDEQGRQIGLAVGFQLTLWLEHNVLIGQGPVGVTVPWAQITIPPQELTKRAVGQLLDKARELRAEASKPKEGFASLDEMVAAMRRGANGNQG